MMESSKNGPVHPKPIDSDDRIFDSMVSPQP